MKKAVLIGTALFLSAVTLSLTGCARPSIFLNAYSANLPQTAKGYQGVRVNLGGVENDAWDTTIWYYYSDNSRLVYEGAPTLADFFEDAFQRAFMAAGMDVSRQGFVPPGRPNLEFTMKSVSEERFVFDLTVYRGRTAVYTRTYRVLEPVPPAGRRDEAALEERAYRMVNTLVRQILTDPHFRRAVTGRPPAKS
jgi:hypothetical protein